MALLQPQSDIAALWEEALNDYKRVTDIDMRGRLNMQRSVNTIMMDQQRQLENFAVFRHDKGKLDRFRTMISSNADIIQGVAQHVADAASAAFPPSSAILTAFTFVMTASKHISDDYDMIEGFFGIMQSFLKRLSLLEDKIPAERDFQIFVVTVFSSLLKLSAIARAYCAKGRFSKWAKALVDGKDPELQAAYEKLTGSLQDLESAIIMKTLRTTIEISEDARSTNQNVKAIQGQLGGISAMSMQTLETSQQTFSVAMRTETGVQQLIHTSINNATAGTEMLRLQNDIAKKLDKMQSKDNKDKQRNMKSGASRPVNFERLWNLLKNQAEGGVSERLADMQLSGIQGLFDWVQQDAAFRQIIDEEESILCVSAKSGMGKSSLAYYMFNYLEQQFSAESTTCITWFPFDEEHFEMRSVNNMLRYCAIRAAKKDAQYCTEVLSTLQRDDPYGLRLEENEDAWKLLIETRFTKESDRRLILVLDGIDQIDEEDFPVFKELLTKIRSLQCTIQVIVSQLSPLYFTCDPEKKQDLSSLKPQFIELSRDRMIHDMRKFTWSRTKTLSRLRKLRLEVRKTIRKKVMQKADSLVYIDHTMRRLNAIGREGPIKKELENLPGSTTALYRMLFEECQKNRTSEDQELLRALLAWLAYMKTKMTVSEANMLIGILKKDNAISIEEELDGRLSRLLRISGDRAEVGQDDSSGDEERISEGDEDAVSRTEDASNFLSFQERSLKAYFRSAIQDHPDGLRCTATEAQAIIFRTCATILTAPEKDQTPAGQQLLSYAARWWLSHLLEIKIGEDDHISDDMAKLIIESIYSVLTNKSDSLKPLELLAVGSKTILNGEEIPQEEVLVALSAWAKRAMPLPPNQLPYGILDWFRPLAQQPLRVFIGLAREHIKNWFSSSNKGEAYSAFVSAHAALREGRNLPELKQSPTLGDYFVEFVEEDNTFTTRSFEVVANCFWDIVKTSSSFRGIGMAMDLCGLYEPSLKQFDKGLEDDTIDTSEKFMLLACKAEGLWWLGTKVELNDEEKKRQYIEESLPIFCQANELYHQMSKAGQVDDDIRSCASFNFGNTAHVAALLGKSEMVLDAVKERLETKSQVPPSNLPDITSALHKAGELTTIIKLLKLLSKTDLTWYLISDTAEVVQEAAMRAGEGQYMLDMYDAAQKAVSTWSFEPAELKTRLQSSAAIFARQALGNVAFARASLREMIDDPKTPTWRVLDGCNQLAEILVEDFRTSNDPRAKQRALEETIKLLEKPAEVLPSVYNPGESHLVVTVALMQRRLGSTLDMSDRLNAGFQNCVEELRDDQGLNDQFALRRLARVLRCIPGFEDAASIAYTAHLYIVDEEVHRKEREAENISQEKDSQALGDGGKAPVDGVETKNGLVVEQEAPTVAQSIDALVNGDSDPGAGGDKNVINTENGVPTNAKPDTVEESTPKTTMNHPDEDLNENASFYCNYCGQVSNDWSSGAYFCMYCIDMDICEGCYQKKIAREKGELEPDWHTICPEGHKHIRGPIQGWKGMKSGIMKIGTEEVPFKAWLVQLEVRWAKYWEDFWTEAEMV
ncbi:hypothetical protein HBH52_200240 [Parastagonospora nodorum]|nr:hypothetical protein HBH52_200240 [Parastagonospora nodorum]